MESDAKRLIRCAYGGDADGLRALLEEGCDANAKDSVGWFGLYQACCGGDDDDHISCARVLLDRGAAVDLVTPSGETSLMAAAFRGHARVARLSLRRHGRDREQPRGRRRAAAPPVPVAPGRLAHIQIFRPRHNFPAQ